MECDLDGGKFRPKDNSRGNCKNANTHSLAHSPTHQSLSLLLGLWGVNGIRRGVQCLVTPAYRWRPLSLPVPGTKQLLGWCAPG